MPTTPAKGRVIATGIGRGVAFFAVSAVASTLMSAGVKHLSAELHPFEIGFFRSVFGLLALTPVFLRYGLAPLRTNRLRLHLLRGGFNVFGGLSFMLGLSLVPLAKLTALNFTGPLFASALAMLVLGEPLRMRRAAALALGFAGALVIIRPGLIAVDAGSLIVVFASLCWGSAMIMVKVLSRTESSVTITLYVAIIVMPFALLAALPFWRTPNLAELAWLAGIGAMHTTAQLFMAQAFKEADATAVLPVDFSRLIWAALIGFLVFAEVPDVWTWTGGVMIFVAVLHLASRKHEGTDGEPSARV